MTHPHHDEKWLESKLREHDSVADVADEAGVTDVTIYRWAKKHGLRGVLPQPGKAGDCEANRVDYATRSMVGAGYYVAQCSISQSAAYIHRLLAVSEYGFGEVSENDTHHKNGIKWDNRPENIEVIDRSEHAKMHSSKYDGGDCAEALEEAKESLGHEPTEKEFKRLITGPDPKTVSRILGDGSWKKAKAKVYGCEASRADKVTKCECIEALREAEEILGHEPTTRGFDELDATPSHSTVVRRFGSWENAKEAAFGAEV